MNRLRLRAENSAKDFYNRRQNEPVEALIGDGAGNVDVSGRLNWVWVRIRGDSYRVAVAYNASARIFAEGDSVNLLWVKRTGIGYYAITGYSGAVSYDIYGSGSGDETGTGVKAHAWQHERRDQGEGGPDPLDLYPRMDMPLRARPQTTPDMTLHVEAGYNQLTGNYYAGGNSAAFSVVALTSGQSRIDLLYMDGADALQVTAGAVTSGWGVPTAPALPAVCTPLAYVYLTYGQTTIEESDIYRDPRITIGAVGFVTPSSAVTSIAKSGSAQLVGDVTLSEGANVTLTQVGQDIEIAASGTPLEVKEADGAPDVTPVIQIIVTNGKLTDNGGGSISLDLSGGGAPHDLLDGSVDQDTVAGTVVAGDIIIGNNTPKWERLAKGSDGDVLTLASGLPGWSPPPGSTPSHAYFDKLAAMLEPMALEVLQKGAFIYVVAAGATKYVMASYSTTINGVGEWEVRDPRRPVAIRGVTLDGLAADSTAVIMDPTLPTYADSWTTYYDRLESIETMQTHFLGLTAKNTDYVLLPGPYGIIITNVTWQQLTWVIGTAFGLGSGFNYNLWNEKGNAAGDITNASNALFLPARKETIAAIRTGDSNGTPLGGVSWVLLPSTWGAVTDPNTYDFRDDFMGATLDTASTWTRTQTAPGQVEIDTTWQWLKVQGDGTWGHNGAYSQASVARAAGKVFLADIFVDPADTTSYCPNFMAGFSDGAGQSYTNLAHAIDFTEDGTGSHNRVLQAFENGTARGTVGSGWSKGYIYRLRITIQAITSQAKYEMQGGTQYGQLGSATWTDITPGTTSSATTPLHAGVTGGGGSNGVNAKVWVSDVKMY